MIEYDTWREYNGYITGNWRGGSGLPSALGIV